MDTNTVAVVTAFGNKLDGYINILAEKAGMASDHFWPILVRQQVIVAWGDIGVYLINILMLGLALTVLFKSLPKKDQNEYIDISPVRMAGVFAGSIASLILFFVICFDTGNLPQTISKIKNPEYYAVQSLIQMVK